MILVKALAIIGAFAIFGGCFGVVWAVDWLDRMGFNFRGAGR